MLFKKTVSLLVVFAIFVTGLSCSAVSVAPLEADNVVPRAYYAGYTDVPVSHWAYDSIANCTTKGIMEGVGHNMFKPEATFERSHLAQILYRSYSSVLPKSYEGEVSDLMSGAWYQPCMRWTIAYGLFNMAVDGNGNYLSLPDTMADRRCVALALFRIAKQLDADWVNSSMEELESFRFPDIASLDTESQLAIMSLCRAGVINGYPDDTYQPNRALTRAEAAALMDRFTNLKGLESSVVQTGDPPQEETGNYDLSTTYGLIRSYADTHGFSLLEEGTLKTVEDVDRLQRKWSLLSADKEENLFSLNYGGENGPFRQYGWDRYLIFSCPDSSGEEYTTMVAFKSASTSDARMWSCYGVRAFSGSICPFEVVVPAKSSYLSYLFPM